MSVQESLFNRYSTREFREAAMEDLALEAFLNGLKEIPLLYEQGDFTIRFLSYGEMNEYFPDDVGALIYAPYYLLFYGDATPDVFQNVGYLGELAILWLTVNGYGSCWQAVKEFRTKRGGETKPAPATENGEEGDAKPSNGRKTPGFMAMFKQGNGDDGRFKNDPLPVALAFGIEDRKQQPRKPARKKPLQRLMVPGSPEPDPVWTRLLDAGRQAPSEYNTQPWRFWFANDGVHLFRKPSFFFRSERHRNMSYVALGCLLANVMTMAQVQGIGLELHREGRSFEQVRGLEYILSFYQSA